MWQHAASLSLKKNKYDQKAVEKDLYSTNKQKNLKRYVCRSKYNAIKTSDKIAMLMKTMTSEGIRGGDKYIPRRHIFLALFTQRRLRSFCPFK